MPDISKYAPLLAVICIGIAVQLLLIPLECMNKPYKTAVAFTEAYFKLDPSMGDYLCEGSKTIDDIDMVAQYIYRATKQAKDRGFRKSFAKSKLYSITTRTTYSSDTEAMVTITAKRRTAINPIFAWIAKLFFIGKTYPLEETLTVMKEDGRWNVCGSPLALHPSV